MRVLKLYKDDFSKPHNSRDTENSTKVVESWFDPMVKYAVEEIPDQTCLRLVAERLIVRRLLGIESLDSGYDNLVGEIEVFGSGTPSYAELTEKNAFVAMAFVPLTPMDDRGKPCLARLYCIDGLTDEYTLPLEGMNESELRGFSWFLEGVPLYARNRGIIGRSWLLAARILIEIVRKRDIKTARNLATHYIVTGDVKNDTIRKVEIKRKPELARQFENFKWIIPKENDMEPRRKIEKPATLEEAYELIETMQNKATRSFFRFLKSGNLEGMKEQYGIGADLFATDENTGSSAMALVADRMREFEKKTRGMTWSPDVTGDGAHPNEFAAFRKVERYREIRAWLQSAGADPVMMLYVLAKFDYVDIVRQLIKVWPIDAMNEDGYNVVELAMRNKDYEVAQKLHDLGGRCKANFSDAFMISLLRCYVREYSNFELKQIKHELEESRKVVMLALAMGLSPAIEVSVDGGLRTSLFGAALYKCDTEMIKSCLDAGADPNEEIEIWKGYYEDEGPDEIRGWVWSHDRDSSGSPLYIVNCGKKSICNCQRESAIKVLKESGARDDERIAKRNFLNAVRSLGTKYDSRSNRDALLKLLDEGMSCDEPKDVKYISYMGESNFEMLRTSLWGWAVYNGDLEIMRKCLENGAKVNAALTFSHINISSGAQYVADLQYLNGRSPVEVILMSEDIPLSIQEEAFDLLKNFGLRDSDCPENLLKTRHADELAALKCTADVEAERGIVFREDENMPEFATTTVMGMAVWFMWVDVLEKCLLLGASARNILHYWGEGPDDSRYNILGETPRNIIENKKEDPVWLRNRALKLLAKYSNR